VGFSENLKKELTYSGLPVKDLAALSGVNKRTIDSYLRINGKSPSAENAVRIAKALGVSVEYLVTGETSDAGTFSRFLPYLEIIEDLQKLPRPLLLSLKDLIKTARSCA